MWLCPQTNSAKQTTGARSLLTVLIYILCLQESLKISKNHISDLERKKQCFQVINQSNDQSIMSLEMEKHRLRKLLNNSLDQNSKKEHENVGLKELLKTSSDRNQILEQKNLDLQESSLCKKCMEQERFHIPFEQIRELEQENNRLQVCLLLQK